MEGNENFCANCGAVPKKKLKKLDSLSVCAECFVVLNEMFDNQEIAADHISGLYEESELEMLIRVGEAFSGVGKLAPC